MVLDVSRAVCLDKNLVEIFVSAITNDLWANRQILGGLILESDLAGLKPCPVACDGIKRRC
jgi:hypothetical protein